VRTRFPPEPGLRQAKIEPRSSLEDAVDFSNLQQSIAELFGRNRQPDLSASAAAVRQDLWRDWDRQLPGNCFAPPTSGGVRIADFA